MRGQSQKCLNGFSNIIYFKCGRQDTNPDSLIPDIIVLNSEDNKELVI